MLRKGVNWTYSAHDIPRSHWIEQGHSEGDAANMEANIRHMKDDVERVRNGTHSEKYLLFEGNLSIQQDAIPDSVMRGEKVGLALHQPSWDMKTY